MVTKVKITRNPGKKETGSPKSPSRKNTTPHSSAWITLTKDRLQRAFARAGFLVLRKHGTIPNNEEHPGLEELRAAYRRIARRAVKLGWLDSMPDTLESPELSKPYFQVVINRPGFA